MSTNKEPGTMAVIEGVAVARLAFAQTVIAFHQSGCKDNALFQAVLTCEQEYLSAYIDDVERSIEFLSAPAQGTA